ncbi:hypothetical protein CAOG_00573 [Capsaspora owczarzaki ATCC 30864]|uniref:Uncharacterized protein n=1 Tax=Capsaspora owczarzaki (strain ATCC 30864) TaxID=595528 RepID=A0A0D2WIR8_CAPO3|nr:hypothetical protein CAOG_00573 [Capsaspora owczarzaki ATCC 30864]KJE89013.1 hypothetical protein CAOG_000573 [Capsaspora owczarzaki ATCC 30864]|eukprot:XP_004365444.1 hypothetical protein CAOG_00573 [Capsaspora owczarzaki ATCC 30864]
MDVLPGQAHSSDPTRLDDSDLPDETGGSRAPEPLLWQDDLDAITQPVQAQQDDGVSFTLTTPTSNSASAGSSVGSYRKFLFHHHIQQMMFAFGDAKETDKDAAYLIEEIVQREIQQIFVNAMNCAIQRQSRYPTVQDVAIALSNDRSRMMRLHEYLNHKDISSQASASTEQADTRTANEAPTFRTGSLSVHLSETFLVDSMCATLGLDVAGLTPKVLNPVTAARLVRADNRTSNMSKAAYMDYTATRRVNFVLHTKRKFWTWVQRHPEADEHPPTHMDDVLDLLAFLAYDLIGLLAELALEVQTASRLAPAPVVGPAAFAPPPLAHSVWLSSQPSGGGAFQALSSFQSPSSFSAEKPANPKLPVEPSPCTVPADSGITAQHVMRAYQLLRQRSEVLGGHSRAALPDQAHFAPTLRFR